MPEGERFTRFADRASQRPNTLRTCLLPRPAGHLPTMKPPAEALLELISIESVTGGESTLADWLESRLRACPSAAGHEIVRLHDSLAVRPKPETPAGAPRPRLVLAGHIDTVPRGEAGPPAIREGRVHGRGSADMKAGVLAMLRVFEEIPLAAGFAARSFVFYAGEEGPADQNALRSLLHELPFLTEVELAVLLEPTHGALELGCQGSLHLDVKFHGRACHSARPWLGVNPLGSALPWLDRMLHRPYREVTLEGVSFRELVSVTQVEMGSSRNVIPETLRANLNLRYPPDRTILEAEALALSLAPSASVASSHIVDHAPAGQISSESELYRHLLESTGLARRAKQAWTDVARFTALGIPALNWGPGDPALAHTKDESIAIDELDQHWNDLRTYLLGPGPKERGTNS